MPAPGTRASTRPAATRRRNGHATGSRDGPPEAARDEGRPWNGPEPEETGHDAWRGRGRVRGASGKPDAAALGGLFRGLRAGDLETVLLTVAMAADENRMPSADPAEERRILAFLARLAGHDAALPPPPPDGSGLAPNRPSDPD